MASQQVDAYSLATPATGDTFIGIDASDTTDSVNGTVKQFAFTDLQPRDATLTALAAFNTNGVLVQTAADTFVGRTLAGTTNRISVTNGDGVSGNPTVDISTAYVGQNTITTLGTVGTGVWQGTAVTAANGGTGLTSYAVGDLLYASASTTLSKLADVATGNVLISGGVTTAPSWGQVGLTTHVTGVLPSANGGTGVNNVGTITNASNTTITSGGTIALGGFTLTVPATGTAALRNVAQTFTAAQAAALAVAGGDGAFYGQSVGGSGSGVVGEHTTSGTGIIALSATGIPLIAQVTGGNSAAINSIIALRTRVAGAGAAGTGGSIDLQLEDSTTNDIDAGKLDWSWVIATHASRTARVKLSVFDTATREGLRIEASGSAAMIGFLGAAAVVQQTAGANVTNNVTSGGTNDTIANFTDLTIYANDAAAIRNDIYQLARLVKQDHDALRLYGLLT